MKQKAKPDESDRLDGSKTEGRTRTGRFAVGNPGGPGRPPRPVEAAYLRALADACPIEVWREVVAKAVEAAKGGDATARAWLGKYLCGEANLTSSLSLHEQVAGFMPGPE